MVSFAYNLSLTIDTVAVINMSEANREEVNQVDWPLGVVLIEYYHFDREEERPLLHHP
jgi:hypothetical protein